MEDSLFPLRFSTASSAQVDGDGQALDATVFWGWDYGRGVLARRLLVAMRTPGSGEGPLCDY